MKFPAADFAPIGFADDERFPGFQTKSGESFLFNVELLSVLFIGLDQFQKINGRLITVHVQLLAPALCIDQDVYGLLTGSGHDQIHFLVIRQFPHLSKLSLEQIVQ